MQACAPALCDTALQNAIHLPLSLPPYIQRSPRCETRAEWCYCINIGKVKTWVKWRSTCDRLERSGERMVRALNATSLRNKQHWGWMKNKDDLSRSNAQGEYNIFSEKTERQKERSALKCILRQKWKKKHWSVRWLSDNLTQVYRAGSYRELLAIAGNDLQTTNLR